MSAAPVSEGAITMFVKVGPSLRIANRLMRRTGERHLEGCSLLRHLERPVQSIKWPRVLASASGPPSDMRSVRRRRSRRSSSQWCE